MVDVDVVHAVSTDDTGAIVADIGHRLARFGFAGNDLPTATFTAAVGILPTPPQSAEGSGAGAGAGGGVGAGAAVPSSAPSAPPPPHSQYVVGDGAVHRYRPGMEVVHPLQDGSIKDWDSLEALWHHGLEAMLHVDVREHPLLVSDHVYSPGQEPEREKLAELLFETFQPMGLYCGRSAALSAFSSGRSTAVVVDLGAGGTTVTPVCDGFAVQRATLRSPLGGDRIDDELVKLLPDPVRPRHTFTKKARAIGTGFDIIPHPPESFTASSMAFLRRALGREIKESVCAVSPVPVRYVRSSVDDDELFEDYELPDGTRVSTKPATYALPELLFDPTPISSPSSPLLPLSTMVHNALKASDSELRKELSSNVMVVGGGSVLPGFSKRLSNELGSLIPMGFKVRVLDLGVLDRRFAAFIGGSILASLGTFQQLWVSKAEYEDEGPGCLGRRCP